MLYSIGIICLALVLPGQGTPSFGSVKIGFNIISGGNSVDLSCKVQNLTDDYSISWYRETITGDRTAIYRDGMLINNDLGREAEAYSLHNAYDVLITQVRGLDLGHLLNGNNYTCEVTLNSTGEVVLVSSGFILVARYSPSSLYPTCESCDFSSNLTGSSVTISCYSELGNPWVQLQWSRNGEAIENLMPVTIHSYIYLNYTFILEADDLESNFSCTNGIQSCTLGPDTCAPNSGIQPASSSIDLLIPIGASNLTSVQASKEDFPTNTGMHQSSTTVTVLQTDPEEQPESGIDLTIVIGASIGAVLFLAFCLFIVVCYCRRKNAKKQIPNITYQQSTDEGRNQDKNTRNEVTIDNASNYAQVMKRPKHTKALNEDMKRDSVESGIIDNFIYDGI